MTRSSAHVQPTMRAPEWHDINVHKQTPYLAGLRSNKAHILSGLAAQSSPLDARPAELQPSISWPLPMQIQSYVVMRSNSDSTLIIKLKFFRHRIVAQRAYARASRFTGDVSRPFIRCGLFLSGVSGFPAPRMHGLAVSPGTFRG